jgi:GNAT superfamily N-acetyltransferase
MKSSFTPGSTHPKSDGAAFLQQSRHSLRDGTMVVVRPIRVGDLELERDFIERLSPKSRRFRFLGSIKTPSAEMLRQFTQPQLTGGVAFVALVGEGSETQEIGVCRYSTGADEGSCECAVAVSDDWQGNGLATILMHRLIETARGHGFQHMYSIDATDNVEMRQLAGHLGFTCEAQPDDPTLVVHTLTLHDSSNAAAPAAATS